MGPSVGFVGGGRIVRIMLDGWRRAGYWPGHVVVSDPDAKATAALRSGDGDLVTVQGENRLAAAQEIVFLAVHPPALRTVCAELSGRIPAASLVVSLAPKLTLAEISAALGGLGRLARVIPNAPSLVGAGFNPTSFTPHVTQTERRTLLDLLTPLGACPQVEERDLEAYALLTGMGPTYLWFQVYELLALAERFGLSRAAAVDALVAMVAGAVRTVAESGLSPTAVMDLVPVRPLADDEEMVKNAYRARLAAVFERIRPAAAAPAQATAEVSR